SDTSLMYYVIKNTFENYKENPLFSLFLYPIFEEQTIITICYDYLFCSLVLEYLQKVCDDIIKAVKWLTAEGKRATSSDGYLMNQVFLWDTKYGNNDNEGLRMKIRFFLEETLHWKNTKQMKIKVRNYDNLIEIADITNPCKNSTLTIPDKEGKAVLRQGGRKIYEFDVARNDDFLSIEAKTSKRPIDEIINLFLERHNTYLIDFLAKLRTRLIKPTSLYSNSTYESLSMDKKYRKALEHLDKELSIRDDFTIK
ncbi:MAG: hypothetical protein M3162_08540, partial [Thermoproteota archaeon]|nr:hypothetical protein [Thermoproteota archaeon]